MHDTVSIDHIREKNTATSTHMSIISYKDCSMYNERMYRMKNWKEEKKYQHSSSGSTCAGMGARQVPVTMVITVVGSTVTNTMKRSTKAIREGIHCLSCKMMVFLHSVIDKKGKGRKTMRTP